MIRHQGSRQLRGSIMAFPERKKLPPGIVEQDTGASPARVVARGKAALKEKQGRKIADKIMAGCGR